MTEQPSGDAPSHPPYIWHNTVHERWADTRLAFFFLSYEPTYNRDDAVSDVQTLLSERHIVAYQIYEVTAPHDLLVRAWIPRRLDPSDLASDLREPQAVSTAQPLTVTKIIHHWPWEIPNKPVGSMNRPQDELLEKGRPVRERALINDTQRDRANTLVNRRLARQLKSEHLITAPNYRDGIRFLVRVRVSGITDDRNDAAKLAALEKRICELLNRSRPVVKRISLYRVRGSEHFLILGQVAPRLSDFYAITQGVVAEINQSAEMGYARTITSFFARPGFLDFQDELQIPEEAHQLPPPDPKQLLASAEGQQLEFKASAFTDVADWLCGKQKEPPKPCKHPAKDARNHAVNSLVRAIASLLNSEGGHIVLGVVEAANYADYRRFKQLPSADTNEVHRLLGLGFECSAHGWDKFARRLRSVIDARFDPVPPPRWIEIMPAHVEGRQLCIIRITQPDEFYWVKVSAGGNNKQSASDIPGSNPRLEKRFFIRTGGQTKPLFDRDISLYEKQTPRSKPTTFAPSRN